MRATWGDTGSTSRRRTVVSRRSPRALRSSWRLVSVWATNSDSFGAATNVPLPFCPYYEAGALEVGEGLADDRAAHVVALTESGLRRDLVVDAQDALEIACSSSCRSW